MHTCHTTGKCHCSFPCGSPMSIAVLCVCVCARWCCRCFLSNVQCAQRKGCVQCSSMCSSVCACSSLFTVSLANVYHSYRRVLHCNRVVYFWVSQWFSMSLKTRHRGVRVFLFSYIYWKMFPRFLFLFFFHFYHKEATNEEISFECFFNFRLTK